MSQHSQQIAQLGNIVNIHTQQINELNIKVNENTKNISILNERTNKIQENVIYLNNAVKDLGNELTETNKRMEKGFDIIYRALGKILKLDLQLIIVGTGDSDFENLFLKSEFKDYDNFSLNIIFDEELAKQVYAGSDIFLMPSKFEPCGLAQMISMKYGTIPVARKTGGLIDTIKDFFVDKKNGNGFLFE